MCECRNCDIHWLTELVGMVVEAGKLQPKIKKAKCAGTIRVWSPGSRVIDVNLNSSIKGAISVSSCESKAESRMTSPLKDHLAGREKKSLSYLAFCC